MMERVSVDAIKKAKEEPKTRGARPDVSDKNNKGSILPMFKEVRGSARTDGNVGRIKGRTRGKVHVQRGRAFLYERQSKEKQALFDAETVTA